MRMTNINLSQKRKKLFNPLKDHSSQEEEQESKEYEGNTCCNYWHVVGVKIGGFWKCGVIGAIPRRMCQNC